MRFFPLKYMNPPHFALGFSTHVPYGFVYNIDLIYRRKLYQNDSTGSEKERKKHIAIHFNFSLDSKPIQMAERCYGFIIL